MIAQSATNGNIIKEYSTTNLWKNLSMAIFFPLNALNQRSRITIQRLRQTQKNISTRGINITTALLILLDQSRRNLCSGRKFITSESCHLPQLLQPCLWMPQTITPIDGVEATRLVCKLRPNVKMLIRTSFGTSTDIARAIQAGASGVLIKDAPSEELPATLRG